MGLNFRISHTNGRNAECIMPYRQTFLTLCAYSRCRVQELKDEAEYLEAEIEFRNIEKDKAVKLVKEAELAANEVDQRIERML